MDDMVVRYWQIILAIVFFIVWQIRLENKVQSNCREFEQLRDTDFKDLKDSLKELSVNTNKLSIIVARIEAVLKTNQGHDD